jgi:hypothetical protein
MVYIAIGYHAWAKGPTREAARTRLREELGYAPKSYYMKAVQDPTAHVTDDGGIAYDPTQGPPMFVEYKKPNRAAVQLVPPVLDLPPEAYEH